MHVDMYLLALIVEGFLSRSKIFIASHDKLQRLLNTVWEWSYCNFYKDWSDIAARDNQKDAARNDLRLLSPQ